MVQNDTGTCEEKAQIQCNDKVSMQKTMMIILMVLVMMLIMTLMMVILELIMMMNDNDCKGSHPPPDPQFF